MRGGVGGIVGEKIVEAMLRKKVFGVWLSNGLVDEEREVGFETQKNIERSGDEKLRKKKQLWISEEIRNGRRQWE